MELIQILVLLAFLLIMIYLSVRNTMVLDFRSEITIQCFDICEAYITSLPENPTAEEEEHYDELKEIWRSIEDVSYDRMLYSFKPLKPKYWFNKEQLDFLALYEQN